MWYPRVPRVVELIIRLRGEFNSAMALQDLLVLKYELLWGAYAIWVQFSAHANFHWVRE